MTSELVLMTLGTSDSNIDLYDTDRHFLDEGGFGLKPPSRNRIFVNPTGRNIARLALSQAQQIVIELNLNFVGTNAQHLAENWRRVLEKLRLAREYSIDGVGSQIELRYRWIGADETVVFEVLDGELTAPAGGDIHLGAVLLKSTKLTLMCSPLARSEFASHSLSSTLTNYQTFYPPTVTGDDVTPSKIKVKNLGNPSPSYTGKYDYIRVATRSRGNPTNFTYPFIPGLAAGGANYSVTPSGAGKIASVEAIVTVKGTSAGGIFPTVQMMCAKGSVVAGTAFGGFCMADFGDPISTTASFVQASAVEIPLNPDTHKPWTIGELNAATWGFRSPTTVGTAFVSEFILRVKWYDRDFVLQHIDLSPTSGSVSGWTVTGAGGVAATALSDGLTTTYLSHVNSFPEDAGSAGLTFTAFTSINSSDVALTTNYYNHIHNPGFETTATNDYAISQGATNNVVNGNFSSWAAPVVAPVFGVTPAPDSWSFVAIDATNNKFASDGAGALVIEYLGDPGPGYMQQVISGLTIGLDYLFSIDLKVTSNAQTAKVSLSGAVGATTYNITSVDTTFTTYTYQFTATGATTLTINLQCNVIDATGLQYAFFDNVALYQMFKVSPSWSRSGSDTCLTTKSTAQTYLGSTDQFIQGGDRDGSYIYQRVTVVPGATYIFYGYVRGLVNIAIKGLTSSTFYTPSLYMTANSANISTWAAFSYAFTVGGSDRQIEIRLFSLSVGHVDTFALYREDNDIDTLCTYTITGHLPDHYGSFRSYVRTVATSAVTLSATYGGSDGLLIANQQNIVPTSSVASIIDTGRVDVPEQPVASDVIVDSYKFAVTIRRDNLGVSPATIFLAIDAMELWPVDENHYEIEPTVGNGVANGYSLVADSQARLPASYVINGSNQRVSSLPYAGSLLYLRPGNHRVFVHVGRTATNDVYSDTFSVEVNYYPRFEWVGD